jgi:hypothetical protein
VLDNSSNVVNGDIYNINGIPVVYGVGIDQGRPVSDNNEIEPVVHGIIIISESNEVFVSEPYSKKYNINSLVK